MTTLIIGLAAVLGLLALIYLLHLIGLVVRGVGMGLGFVIVRVLFVVGFGVGCWALLTWAGVL